MASVDGIHENPQNMRPFDRVRRTSICFVLADLSLIPFEPNNVQTQRVINTKTNVAH